MPTFSRWMPTAPERRATATGRALRALLAAGGAVAVAVSPAARVLALVLAVGLGVATVADRHGRRTLRTRRTLRAGEDIGTFVRALNRRDPAFDAWVVRAVWDALRAELRAGGVDVALRPEDRLEADLGIDAEDLVFDVLPAVAARTGRFAAWDDVRAVPASAQVETVADLIRLIALQPRRAAA